MQWPAVGAYRFSLRATAVLDVTTEGKISDRKDDRIPPSEGTNTFTGETEVLIMKNKVPLPERSAIQAVAMSQRD